MVTNEDKILLKTCASKLKDKHGVCILCGFIEAVWFDRSTRCCKFQWSSKCSAAYIRVAASPSSHSTTVIYSTSSRSMTGQSRLVLRG